MILHKIYEYLMKIFRKKINYLNRNRLINKNPTVITSNCNGGILLHDLHLEFQTPTINLFILPKDFLKFVSDLEHYRNLSMLENKHGNYKYPVGKLGDIDIHFLHYENFAEAKMKWSERVKRINLKNVFIMMTDRDGCTDEDIKNFDALPYRNKVIFTHKEYPSIESAYYIKGFEKENCVGILSEFEGWRGRRYLDQFDYVSFLNKEL